MVFALLFAGPVTADTANDCIADYRAARTLFSAASRDIEYECTRIATALALSGTAAPKPGCKGDSDWRFEAKSLVGDPGLCITRFLGSEGEDCSAERVERELPTPEAARWQNFLLSECRELGSIRGMSPQDAE